MGKEPCSWRAQAQGFQAGQAGHADVGDHHVDLLLAQDFQRAFAGGDGDGLEALAGKKESKQAALAGVVIHDEQARDRRGAGSFPEARLILHL